ncbi:MAG: SurA N-terminal domain-containing protein [Patescibacteria group bacterium]|nr:SurA N-terminal domain-containing protein [Patescibacteria group bacterium]
MDNNQEVKSTSESHEHHHEGQHATHHSAEHHEAEHHNAAHEAASHSEANKKRIKVNLKVTIVVACVIVLGALLFVYKGLFIAAVVNGSPISRLAVIQQLESTSGKSTLENIIVEKLIKDEAKKQKIVVSNDEINSEVSNVEKQITSQGGTLAQALASQNMTMDTLRDQILVEKELEGLLADKIQVTDADVATYIKDNKVKIPAGQEDTYKAQISQQLKQQKLSGVVNDYISSLRSKANISYFVNY